VEVLPDLRCRLGVIPGEPPAVLVAALVPGNRPPYWEDRRSFFRQPFAGQRDNTRPDSEPLWRREGRIQSAQWHWTRLRCALQLLPGDELPGNIRRVTGRTLDEAGIERLLRNSLAGGSLSKTFHDDDLRFLSQVPRRKPHCSTIAFVFDSNAETQPWHHDP